jgi:beta-glucosidase
MKQFFTAVIIIFSAFSMHAQLYKDPSQPIEARVLNLLSLMTPEEKFRQLFMIPGEIGADSSLYNAGIFGFQVSTTGQNADAAGQMLKLQRRKFCL